ncbi:hypothetical protein BFF78_09875 [Streptomyces fodineus]|uniref:Uncharacterized protein n=1 Tax=Streptomyces fodineus TaxID=1904616 RepID=A0A1D7Y6U2_9ACTN|nr:hypothetical protein [Streptomyces fodineus]AOR31302.1 hypothetical protein BFF78_09875 [Streptomyces fodineus]
MRSDSAPKTVPGRIAMALVMLFVGVLFSGLGGGGAVGLADGLKYSTRMSGAPGLLRIETCDTTGSGKQRHTDCFGLFRSDDHRVVDQFASIGDSYKAGTVLPVQHDAEGHCYVVGVAPTAGRLAGICACVVALVAGLASLCGAFSAAMPRLGGRIGAALWSPGAGRALVRLLKACGIGFAICGVTGVIGWLAMP